ncbi:MAG: hypothetical protein K9W44_14115 [Candidatus Lokiarchaeota archaeon]|nr:hypothetical protein [Candidatus Harpocratesius repetitus]
MVERVWVHIPQPIKINDELKNQINEIVTKFIKKSEKLAKLTHKVKITRGRIYITYLYEVPLEHRARKIEPLINGKYEEFIFARITLFEEKLTHCTADWQRHNLKWYTVHEGTLEDCLKYIENDFGPFGYPFDYKVMN